MISLQRDLSSSGATHGTIIRSRRDDVIVEGIPLQVEHLPRMADDFAALEIDAAGLPERNDNERRVRDDGHEQRIHGA